MNDEFSHNLQVAFADLPNGLDGASDDEIATIIKQTATGVLRAHDGA